MALSQEQLENAKPYELSDSVKCRSLGKCCFRLDNGACNALDDTKFSDGLCHFRKEKEDGQNLYEKEKDIKIRTKGDQVREMIALLREDGLSIKKISLAVGLSERTVIRHLSLIDAGKEEKDETGRHAPGSV